MCFREEWDDLSRVPSDEDVFDITGLDLETNKLDASLWTKRTRMWGEYRTWGVALVLHSIALTELGGFQNYNNPN